MPNRLCQLSKHPLLVAFVSSCLFAGVVVWVGSCLQNKNWIRQHRAELAERLFYLNKKRETNVWNMYSSCNNDDRENQVKYWDLRGEIISEVHSMKQQLAVYFGLKKEPGLFEALNGIHKIWHEVEDKLSSYPSCKEITKKYIEDEGNKVSGYERKIIEIFKRILYK
jgi:hypothetical protein